MHMYGQRAAQNGRWVNFFVTKCRDLFCDQGGGWGAGLGRYIHPCSLCREATAVESAWTGRAVPVLITCLTQKDSLSFELIPPPPSTPSNPWGRAPLCGVEAWWGERTRANVPEKGGSLTAAAVLCVFSGNYPDSLGHPFQALLLTHTSTRRETPVSGEVLWQPDV